MKVEIMPTPCVSKGGLCIRMNVPEAKGGCYEKVIFTGNSLHIGGCGRLLEGTGR